MENIFDRTALLLTSGALKKLENANVLVVGLGGVGSYAAESLARCSVGNMHIVDGDCVTKSNINRQLYALNSTVGKPKVEVAKERILDINPKINLVAQNKFLEPEDIEKIDFSQYDFVADAIDSVRSKVELIHSAYSAGVPVISCMGTGNKLNPELLRIADISKTSVCPLAKAVRTNLRKLGINKGVAAVFSTEEPLPCKDAVGSVSFVPSVAGLMMTSHIIKELTK